MVSLNWDELEKLYCPFNKGIELGHYFNYLKEAFDIDLVIETGTLKGDATKFLEFLFKEVHSIELHKKFYEDSRRSLAQYGNIKSILEIPL